MPQNPDQNGYSVIEAPDDPRLVAFRLNERQLASRADRRDDAGAGLFLAEGDLVVERAFTAGCRPHMVLADAGRVPAITGELARAGAEVFVGGERVRQLITGLGMPHPIVALFHRPARPTPAELAARCDRLVIVEGVDNPSNVGAIVRNAAGLGWDGLLLDHTSADPLARRSLRVAMGTAFSLPHARTTDLPAFIASLEGFERYALTPGLDAIDVRDVRPSGRRAVLIGSERSGLSEQLLGLATPIRIDMADGVDSLNAAAATAVACFALQ
jgi:tRNA G18 (ribose-2'-O)-methylase SpoU